MPRKRTFRLNFEAEQKNLQQNYVKMGVQLALFNSIDLKQAFYDTDLGQLYQAIPFEELSRQFVNQKTPKSSAGRKPIFTLRGALGLMFLKHYTGLSDSKLIANISTNWVFQMFCDLPPSALIQIRDKDIVGRWRGFFGHRADMNVFQEVLAKVWKPYLEHTHIGMMDATVYESYIKYPTDAKLLFDCVKWLHTSIKKVCKALKQARPRSKYLDIESRNLAYSKLKKKTKTKTKKHIKSLLYLCGKLLYQLKDLNYYPILKEPGERQIQLISTILEQQIQHFNDPQASIPNRIVSLFKPYLRPIVRGKENKNVEFGAKVHLHQVGGCNFIENLSFEAFHEGIRLDQTVAFHTKHFGKMTALGADRIYASNANRRFCRENGVNTNFAPKGLQGKYQKAKSKLRSILGKVRATRLEGSFGNEKNHYLLRKVKARTKETEIAWILFGVHTANAVKIAKAIKAQKAKIVNQAA